MKTFWYCETHLLKNLQSKKTKENTKLNYITIQLIQLWPNPTKEEAQFKISNRLFEKTSPDPTQQKNPGKRCIFEKNRKEEDVCEMVQPTIDFGRNFWCALHHFYPEELRMDFCSFLVWNYQKKRLQYNATRMLLHSIFFYHRKLKFFHQ